MRILLLSTYELGRQPFGLASPAAWLRAAGHDVTVCDLSRDELQPELIRDAHLVAIYIPMHTALRLALKILGKVRENNPSVRICCYGLYAPLNESVLRAAGVQTILGGEFEPGLVAWAGGTGSSSVSLERLRFLIPDRAGLPALDRYAQLQAIAKSGVAGYTEASRGCKHLCRHCPIVPVYNGTFRVVQRDVVLADIRQQVSAGASHITFGDPDFFNGVSHGLRIVELLHEEFPALTYDVTIKVEHLLKHRSALDTLKRTGCLFVTSAVESVDDEILARLAKGHTRADFVEVVKVMREVGLSLSPTFVAFTPWTTRQGYQDLLRCLVDLDLVESVAPIQFAIRLLIPAGSLLLELKDVQGIAGPFDAEAFAHRWLHPDQAMDALCSAIQRRIAREEKAGKSRTEIFLQVWELANGLPLNIPLAGRATVPYLNEPWYC